MLFGEYKYMELTTQVSFGGKEVKGLWTRCVLIQLICGLFMAWLLVSWSMDSFQIIKVQFATTGLSRWTKIPVRDYTCDIAVRIDRLVLLQFGDQDLECLLVALCEYLDRLGYVAKMFRCCLDQEVTGWKQLFLENAAAPNLLLNSGAAVLPGNSCFQPLLDPNMAWSFQAKVFSAAASMDQPQRFFPCWRNYWSCPLCWLCLCLDMSYVQ